MADPITGLADLDRRRSQASRRIDEVEAQWRNANIALAQARDALVEFERRGGPTAERGRLETTLAAAEAAALQPWQERSSGARRALGDLGVDRQRYVAEHFDALVAEREAEGEAVAGRVTDAADVSRSRADELARAANALLFAGGEEPPVLSHDPRKPHHAEAVSA